MAKEKKEPHKPQWTALFVLNFFGVFNDNVIKYFIVFFSIHWVAQESQQQLIGLSSAMLVIPFFLFSPLAGRWAVIYSKKRILQFCKLAELPIVCVAIVGLYLEVTGWLLAAVFLIGTQSALMSPSKYGLIRDIGKQERISWGTGSLEMLSFLAILGGCAGAAFLAENYHREAFSLQLLLFALIGWIAAKKLHAEEEPKGDRSETTSNPLTFIKKSFHTARKIEGVHFSIIGLCFFWFSVALVQLNLIQYCDYVLKTGTLQKGLVMIAAAIGIAVGCWLAGMLSFRSFNLRLILIGGILITLFLLWFGLVQLEQTLFFVAISLMAVFYGFFKVPLNALLQRQAKGRCLGDMLAYNNMISFAGIAVASLFFGETDKILNGFGNFHYTEVLFLLCALLSAIVTLSIARNVFYFQSKIDNSTDKK